MTLKLTKKIDLALDDMPITYADTSKFEKSYTFKLNRKFKSYAP